MCEDTPDPICGKQVHEQIALHLPESICEGKNGLRVVMESQEDRQKKSHKKWHKPSIVVLNIQRRLSDIKQIIKQQFEYLKLEILNCNAMQWFLISNIVDWFYKGAFIFFFN